MGELPKQGGRGLESIQQLGFGRFDPQTRAPSPARRRDQLRSGPGSSSRKGPQARSELPSGGLGPSRLPAARRDPHPASLARRGEPRRPGACAGQIRDVAPARVDPAPDALRRHPAGGLVLAVSGLRPHRLGPARRDPRPAHPLGPLPRGRLRGRTRHAACCAPPPASAATPRPSSPTPWAWSCSTTRVPGPAATCTSSSCSTWTTRPARSCWARPRPPTRSRAGTQSARSTSWCARTSSAPMRVRSPRCWSASGGSSSSSTTAPAKSIRPSGCRPASRSIPTSTRSWSSAACASGHVSVRERRTPAARPPQGA